MTSIGWEFWGLKFSWLVVAGVSTILFVYTWLRTHGTTHYSSHVDGMAGDEGED